MKYPKRILVGAAALLWLIFAVIDTGSAQTITYEVPGGGFKLDVAKGWFQDPDADRNQLRLKPRSRPDGHLSVYTYYTLKPLAVWMDPFLEKEKTGLASVSVEKKGEGDGEKVRRAAITFKVKRKDILREYTFIPEAQRILVAVFECPVARMSPLRKDINAMVASIQSIDVTPAVRLEEQGFSLAEELPGIKYNRSLDFESTQKELTGGMLHVFFSTEAKGGVPSAAISLIVFEDGGPKSFEELRKKVENEWTHYNNIVTNRSDSLLLHGQEAVFLDYTVNLGESIQASQLCAWKSGTVSYVARMYCHSNEKELYADAFDHFVAVLRTDG